ncbi:MAG TPA: class I SAM-dependent methyltransferase [Longimicrobiaceae bacterium]|nr:class I SAM-dependent methyltransferase [Longimicrobiaceae bacterium]
MSTRPRGPRAAEDWFEDWFGEEYLQLYPHRDDSEAERAVELIVGRLRLPAGSPALDLACGAGRHVAHLRDAGLRAFGLDLSAELLEVARDDGLPTVRSDMRQIPVATGRLALVTSFFTSFGYLPDAEDDERVVAEVHRVLAPGGYFSVDFLNADRVRARLRAHDEVELGSRRVVQTRELVEGGTVVEKRIEIFDAGRARPRVFHERVRLYSADDLARLMERCRLEPVATFGDYAGGPLAPEAPRAIVIGRAR